MPRRKSLTRRLIQHLLLISLARTILTAVGRGRAWDEWDERKLDSPQPTEPRKHKRRFVQTLSFSALFFAGLALSAGAGNGVRTLLDDGAAVVGRRDRGHRADRPDRRDRRDRRGLGHTGLASLAGARRPGAAAGRPSSGRPPRRHARDGEGRDRRRLAAARLAGGPDEAGRAREDEARAALAGQARAPARHLEAEARLRRRRRSTPRSPSFPSATVWLNRAAPDPTPPAARLKLGFARQLVSLLAGGARRLGARARDAAGRGPQRPGPGQRLGPARARLQALGLRRARQPVGRGARLLERHRACRPRGRASALLPRRRARESGQRPALAEGRPAGSRPARPAPADLPRWAAGRRQRPASTSACSR